MTVIFCTFVIFVHLLGGVSAVDTHILTLKGLKNEVARWQECQRALIGLGGCAGQVVSWASHRLGHREHRSWPPVQRSRYNRSIPLQRGSRRGGRRLLFWAVGQAGRVRVSSPSCQSLRSFHHFPSVWTSIAIENIKADSGWKYKGESDTVPRMWLPRIYYTILRRGYGWQAD